MDLRNAGRPLEQQFVLPKIVYVNGLRRLKIKAFIVRRTMSYVCVFASVPVSVDARPAEAITVLLFLVGLSYQPFMEYR